MSEIIRYKPSEMADAILGLDSSSIRLQSIRVKTPPNKIEYSINETFDSTGIVIEGVYSNDLLKNITSNCTYNIPSFSSLGTKTITISYTEKGVTKTTNLNVTVASLIYGAEWDGSSTSKWTRTDAASSFSDPSPAVNNGNGSSPFDSILPWSGMTIVEDSAAGTLVRIPKFYYKWTRNGNAMKLQITSDYKEGFSVSPAHMDRGDGKGERSVVYIGRYHCANDYKSKTNVSPMGNFNRSGFRTYIHNLGSDIWQNDYALFWTIRMLYLVEFADWNSQKVIGYGCSPNGYTENTGGTDSMVYHTGTSAANRTTYGWTQYRHIEDLWGNVADFCDGIYFSGSSVYAILNPSLFSDNSNGTLTGSRITSQGYITKWSEVEVSGLEWCIYPIAVSGSDLTYITDYHNYNSSGQVLQIGGYVTNSLNNGLFYLNDSYGSSDYSSYIGSRLMKLP